MNESFLTEEERALLVKLEECVLDFQKLDWEGQSGTKSLIVYEFNELINKTKSVVARRLMSRIYKLYGGSVE